MARDDFEVFDNGTPQEITIFDNEVRPFTVVVMLDTSISMTDRLKDLYAGAEQFLLRLMPHDKATVGAFNDKIEFASGFTSDRNSLVSGLKHLDFGNQTRLYDAVHASLDELEKVEGRKVILLFTDGADFGSRQGSGKALERARDAEVMIYGIGLETEFFNGQMVVRSKPDSILNRFAGETGGGYFDLKKDADLNTLVHPHRAGTAQPVPARLQPGRARRQGPQAGSAREAARSENEEPPQLHRVRRRHDSLAAASMESFLTDVNHALRGLRKNPTFTIAALTMLALGIGVNAAVFTVTKAALFAGFPLVERNDRLLYLTSSRGCCVSYPDFEDWRAQARSFERMALVHGVQKILSDQNGFSESYNATEITADTFTLVGQKPILGRDFTPADEVPGAAPVAILSYSFWERRYGKDPAIIGQAVRINGTPTAVVGVMPDGFSFPQKLDLWVPLVPTPDVRTRDARDTWFVFGRVADGVTIEAAKAEMETIGQRLERAYPATNEGFLPHVRNFREFFIFENEDVIYTSMWGAVGFLLLITCANLANLLLARAMERSREISVRIALGAGRWRIVRQLLIESLMLSSVGAICGWWIAKWSVSAYALAERGPGRSSWRILDYTMDYRVLGYLVAISIGTAFLFGLTPALRLSRLDVNRALKQGGRGAAGGAGGRHLSAVLLIAEVALAVVLLAGAGVMTRSFLNIYNADVGVKTENILTVAMELPVATYPRREAWVPFFDRVRAGLEAIPGVESVAITSRLPAGGSRRLPYELASAARVDDERRPVLSALTIGPTYFRTLAVPVLAGREFNDADGLSGVPVVIVNQQFASRHWPGENPLHQRLRVFAGQTPEEWLTVVGVVGNVVQDDRTRQTFQPVIYVPYRQEPVKGMSIVARTRVPPESLGTAFRREIKAADSDLPMFGPFTLAERLQANYWSSGLYGVLFLIFAAIALLLASLGLYAVIAHSVSLRTREIGVRMAIGATARDVRGLVIAQGMRPLAIGLAIGLIASFGLNRVLTSQLVQVSPADPATLMVVCAVLVAAGTLGCLLPAHRASRVDPLVALRVE